MEIYIDDILIDTDNESSVAVTYSIRTLDDLDRVRVPFSKTILIPATSNNSKVLGDFRQINAGKSFNETSHTARIEKDGFVVLDGEAVVTGCSVRSRGADYYRITITGAGKHWARSAGQMSISSLEMDFSMVVSGAQIAESWTWNKPVRFLPVCRKSLVASNVNSNVARPLKVMSEQDYHPFLHLKAVVCHIFHKTGYKINSEFLNGDFFETLYMSGSFPESDSEKLRAKMDFKAGRFISATATANAMGIVYADPLRKVNSVGNVVDTANPLETSDGKTIEGVYSVNDCFQKIGDRIAFVPTEQVTVAFEYSIFYTTGCSIKSRTELSGINGIQLGDGNTHRFTLANNHTDRRDNIHLDKTYMLIVYDYKEGDRFILQYDEITNPDADLENLRPEDIMTNFYANFSSKTYMVTFRGSYPVTNPRLWIYTEEGYISSTKDWALYDGHITEKGSVDVEIILRSSAESVTKASPKYFDDIVFYGGDGGTAFTLNKATTVKPVFSLFPASGSRIGWEDVSVYGSSCLELLRSVKQLFNLQFLTDELSKTVYIEPADRFFGSGPLVDWSGRIDLGKPFEISDAAEDLSREVIFKYADPDDSVRKWNNENSARMGEWITRIESYAAGETPKVYENKFFTPGVSERGVLSSAASAYLLKVGSWDESHDSGGYNFAPKIVQYLGMVSLGRNQQWSWPSETSKYPLLAFRYPGIAGDEPGTGVEPDPDDSPYLQELFINGFTLGFENTAYAEGLQRFYDSDIERAANCKRVEAHIKLYPTDIEPFITPNRLLKDFRARYLLEIDGEPTVFRLEEITDFDPSREGSTKCTFIKES